MPVTAYAWEGVLSKYIAIQKYMENLNETSLNFIQRHISRNPGRDIRSRGKLFLCPRVYK